MRSRLDLEMTRRGLSESRESAQRLIMAGRVRVNSRPAGKPDLRVDSTAEIVLVGAQAEYASRGGYKLAAALDHFVLAVNGRHALDVGYGQLAERLRTDPHVTVLDRTNIRYVEVKDLPYRPDLIVIDTSFISLRLVLPAILRVVADAADIIALVKPQFEVGKGKVGKGGIVRDEALRREALDGVLKFASGIGLKLIGVIESPIKGASGNQEFLAAFHYSNHAG